MCGVNKQTPRRRFMKGSLSPPRRQLFDRARVATITEREGGREGDESDDI